MASIPKSFWHSLSFCMVTVTVVLLVIAWKSSSVSIEVDSYKVKLKSVVVDTKKAQQQLELRRKRLIDAETLLKERIDELSYVTNQLKSDECISELPRPSREDAFLRSIELFLSTDNDAQLQSLQEAIKGLNKLESGLAEQ
ncbi:hypothetical protein [Marinobacter oulmenensis]|uniref:Uncharacterized protein n=1 Tax=Marinobacter oulmenensis TaxID=643747 RepID=A0A840UEN9_9GAMM|nr:hypothetical protein [Marinobacter oulmenensis]MBB5321181.1 hypothetical protein [Marinobacter oulmenensis]